MISNAALLADVKPGWMQTYSGRQFFPAAPKMEDIVVEDIAHALAHQNRWAGHTRHPFSVGQHSVLCSRLVPATDALWALLHDASEAYLVDVPRLIKRLPAMTMYRVMEAVLQKNIYLKFGLAGDEPESVKTADLLMMVAEAQDLLPTLHAGWPEAIRCGTAARPDFRITECWSAPRAKSEFLKRFEALTAARVVAPMTTTVASSP